MSRHLIRSEIVAAFHHCERKAFLMLQGDQGENENSYTAMEDEARDRCKIKLRAYVHKNYPGATTSFPEILKSGTEAILDAYLENDSLCGTGDALLPARKSSGKHNATFEVVVATPHHIVVTHEKIRLGVVAAILATKQGSLPKSGYLFTPDQKLHLIRLQTIIPQVKKTVGIISKWITKVVTDEPAVILNKHCAECPFRISCKNIAVRDDSLTLLNGVTPKKIQQFHKKGIFTVTQLSYQFRPRKSRLHARKMPIYKPELQALAIRTKTTYVVQVPEFKRSETEIFLDFEGVPERSYYYLAGLVVKTGKAMTSYSFWADTPDNESKLWKSVLDVVRQHPEAAIFHYGHYESKACHTLAKKYGCGAIDIEKRLVNVVSLIYGRVYFPVYGNGLKEVGEKLGIKWSPPLDSGLKSLAWRQRWEWSHDAEIKRQLLVYNQQDCEALRTVVDRLTDVSKLVENDPSVDYADNPKRQATPSGEGMHKDFNNLLLLGHSRYSEKRIAFAKKSIEALGAEDDHAPKKQRTKLPRATKTVEVAPRRKCPKCKNLTIRVRKKLSKAIVVDLAFTASGCRKTITQFVGPMIQCLKCDTLSIPGRIQALRGKRHGHQLNSFIAYQRMVLRLSLRTISSSLGEVYGVNVSTGTIDLLMSRTAVEHAATESRISKRILGAPCVHCDETKVNIEGENHYVWVITDGEHVIFKSTPSRESDWVKSFLADYSGILVSDFYAGYDSISCRQQKCMSHLIRDLNENLWKERRIQNVSEYLEEDSFRLVGCMV